MADNSAKIANMARHLSITHIIVGFPLFCFGIADVVVDEYFWTGYGGFGIWIGAWMCIAGGLGIPGTRKEPSASRNCLAGVFMGSSITSAVFGGVIIICYSIAIAAYRHDYSHRSRYNYRANESLFRDDSLWNRRYDTEMAISAIILILGIVEFVIGIWAAVCLCLMNPCKCCYRNPPQQGPGGGPVAFPMQPMQAGGGMIAVQAGTPGAQDGQPQIVMVNVSGAMGVNQPQVQFIQVATSQSGAMATGYQPQQVKTPPPYEQIPVKI
ncbi:hypothetical protein OS493_032291 [Desmophyllum pertusum]|uniref:Uncharacterized protein n=1 Tax=Desmophyllum pertusum TaxID=174260 RepID=A0A9W9Z8M4_9CNID|nr:hypothetical protein OS493_032291 [Desmophyllum pertusum]